MEHYFITGTSRGIGKALAGRLLEQGHKVTGFARSSALQHANYRHFRLDFSDTESLGKQADTYFDTTGPPDRVVLVNNAGTLGEVAYLGNLSPAEITRLFEVNVIAPAILMNAFIKKFKGVAAEKVILNISSGAAGRPVDGWSGYCSSKAALNMLSEVAAKENALTGDGFKIFALAPGVVDTAMQDQIRTSAREDFSDVKNFIALKEENQLADPGIVADKIVQFLKNAASHSGVIQDLRKL